MGMSYDTASLEKVVQFAGLLELISDPKKLLEIVGDAKNVLAETKTLLGPLQTKEQADRYLDEAKEKLAATQAQIVSEFAEVDKQVAAKQALADELRAKAEVELTEAKTVKAEAVQAAADAKKLKADVAKELELAKVERAVLEQTKREFDEASAAMAEKQTKLQALLGV